MKILFCSAAYPPQKKRKGREATEGLILVLTVIDLVLQSLCSPLQESIGFYFVAEPLTS